MTFSLGQLTDASYGADRVTARIDLLDAWRLVRRWLVGHANLLLAADWKALTWRGADRGAVGLDLLDTWGLVGLLGRVAHISSLDSYWSMLIIGDVLTGSPQASISSTLGGSYGVTLS